jgi:hypothetical protein
MDLQNNMNLYVIKIRHCSPKDCKESILGYYLATNDLSIMQYIDKKLMFGTWTDRHNEDGLFDITDNDGNIIGTETYFDRMLRLRGEFHDPDVDYSDSYYGITHYGWDEGKEISSTDISFLLNLGVAKYLNQDT